MKKIYGIFAALLLISACGGGGGGGVTSPPPPPAALSPVTLEEKMEGIWNGSAFDPAGVFTDNVTGLMAITFDNGWLSDDPISGEMSQFTIVNGTENNDGTVSGVAQVWATIDTSVQVDYVGTVVQGVSMDLSYTDSFTGTPLGSISVTYNAAAYERDASFAIIEGLWTDVLGNTWQISNDGSFFTQNASGCVFIGAILPIEPTRNSYAVGATSTGCGFVVNNIWTGIAATDDNQVTNDTIILQIEGGGPYRTTDILTRQ